MYMIVDMLVIYAVAIQQYADSTAGSLSIEINMYVGWTQFDHVL